MAEKYASMEDGALLLLASRGDREAEEQLAVRYSRLVRICARPFFLAGGDSEDLTQEGMFGLLRAIREYDPGTGVPFHSFAETCIRNRLLSAIKSASRRKHMPLNSGVSLEEILSEEASPALPPEIAFRRDPEEMVLARESADELFHTFDRYLSKYEREVLSLYLEGSSYRDMAQATGRSEKSVDNAVQRIRRKLARYLDPGDSSES
jgi:RNA polymerase sporulation-specific sigma factor